MEISYIRLIVLTLQHRTRTDRVNSETDMEQTPAEDHIESSELDLTEKPIEALQEEETAKPVARQEISRNTREDRALVVRAQKGEPKAFEKLLKKYRKSVYYMLLKMVRNSDDAEDLAQEAFAKAFASIERFDQTYAFSTWLFRRGYRSRSFESVFCE